MIKLVRFSGAMFAAALLLCAFAVASQDKDAPSNVAKNPPSNVVLEDRFEKLQADFLKTKQELEQKLDAANRRLDSMDREHKLDTTIRTLDNMDRLILSVRRGTVDESSVLPPASSAFPALSDGRSDYMICNRVAGASITPYRAVGMFIIANHVADTPIIALGMSIIPDGSIIPSRAGGTPIASWISADGVNGVPNSHHWGSGRRAAASAVQQTPGINDYLRPRLPGQELTFSTVTARRFCE